MSEKKIFIIEDDVDILYGLSAQLGAEDFVVETSDGDEELDALLQSILDFDPDYIILDLILPKLDGFEVLKKIREEAELSDIPVFIFTDLSDEDSRQRSLNMGADQYFLKDDFDIYQFAEKIKKIIANQDDPVSAEDLDLGLD
ncbi:MAG: response regulator [Patescibacteria group bacterium]|jgi:DNA-binding response OmpR family regulator|nr:response regulator [Patescibacteria group bacterium]